MALHASTYMCTTCLPVDPGVLLHHSFSHFSRLRKLEAKWLSSIQAGRHHKTEPEHRHAV